MTGQRVSSQNRSTGKVKKEDPAGARRAERAYLNAVAERDEAVAIFVAVTGRPS